MSELQKKIDTCLIDGSIDKLLEYKEQLGLELKLNPEALNQLLASTIINTNWDTLKKVLRLINHKLDLTGDSYYFKPIDKLIELQASMNNPELIQYGFEKIIRKGNLDLMTELIIKSKKQPDFNKLSNTIQEFYKNELSQSYTRLLIFMKEYSGISVSTTVTDGLYKNLLDKYVGHSYDTERTETLKHIKSIKELSGNHIPKNEITSAMAKMEICSKSQYNEIIFNFERLDDLIRLGKETETEIPSDLIKELYTKLINSGGRDEEKTKKLIHLKNKLPYNIDKSLLNKTCQEMITCDFKSFNQLKTEFKLEFDKTFYTKAYEKLLDHGYDFDRNINTLLEIINESNVPLSTELITKTQKMLIGTGAITNLIFFTKKIHVDADFTGINTQELYLKMLEYKTSKNSFDYVKERTKEQVSNETFNKYCKNIFTSKNSLSDKCHTLDEASMSTGLKVDYKTLMNELN